MHVAVERAGRAGRIWLVGVWADTRISTRGLLLTMMPRLVESSWIRTDERMDVRRSLWSECMGKHGSQGRRCLTKMPRSVELSWIGLTRMDVRRSSRTFGYTGEKSAEIPRSSGTECQSIVNMRLGIRNTVQLVCLYGTKNLPRSTNCEMQARNRSFSRICKLWEQLRSWRLEDFNTTVVGPVRVRCVCHIVFGLDCGMWLYSFGMRTVGARLLDVGWKI